MAHGDFKDLTRRATANKILADKAFNIAKNWKYDGYQRSLASIFLAKKLLVVLLKIKICQTKN